MNNPKRKGTCPKCKEVNIPLTKHHLLPKVFFKGQGGIVYICRECHNKLEVYIMKIEGRNPKTGKRNRLEQTFYKLLYYNFIGKTKK